MFTSDIKISKRYVKISIIIAAFCAVFAGIYEYFSYGEYSLAMRWMFLIPLLGCALVGWCIRLTGKPVNLWCYRFWNSGMAVWTVGCLVSGIITISGRSSVYDMTYRCVGAAFVALAFLTEALTLPEKRKKQSEVLV